MHNIYNDRKNSLNRSLIRLLLIPILIINGAFGFSFSPAAPKANTLGLANWPDGVPAVSAASTSEWTQDAHDAQRSGYTAEEPQEPWSLAWTWNGPDANGGTGGHLYNAPRDARTVTGGSFIFVPAGANGLYALHKNDGSQAWHMTGATFNAAPAYDPATSFLYAGGADGKLYKVDSATGTIAGTYTAGSGLNQSVLLVGTNAYVLTDSGQMHKVNTANMSLAWMYAAGSNTATPAAYSAAKDLLIYCTADLFVHAVRDADGGEQWKIKPTSHAAQDPYTFVGSWPVVAEQHGLVFVRLNLGSDALFSGTLQGTSGGGVYPLSSADIRTLLLSNNAALQNLFALDLNDGSQKFVPAVGYGGVEYRTDQTASGLFLQSGAMPVVKVNPDGSEVAYIPFRSGQGSPPDGRWDSHMGEMVLDATTIPGLAAGDLRYVDFQNSQVKVSDEQTPFTMAGNTLLHAHWGASESTKILDRSASLGLSATSPITTTAHPAIIRRQQSCSNFNPTTHQTSCGLTLFGDGRYWNGPGFWIYWNVLDPPTPVMSSYSQGLQPRYTYVSDGMMVVEGNGGDLSIFRYSGAAPSPTATTGPSRTPTTAPTQTVTKTTAPTTLPATATQTSTALPTSTKTTAPTTLPATATRTSTALPTATKTTVPTTLPATVTRTSTALPSATKTATSVNTALPTATKTATQTATKLPSATNTAVMTATKTANPTAVPPTPTPGSGSSLTLKTYADFSSSCAVNTNTHVSDQNGGSVLLAAAAADHFDGTTLNSSLWASGSWTGGTYTTSQSSSQLKEPAGGYVRSKSTYTHAVIETVAQFGLSAWQHIGFGSDGFSSNRYFIFSTYTGDGNLYARVNNNGAEQRVNLGAIPSGMHRYRIEWTAVNATTDSVNFFKDGVLAAQMTVSSTGATGWYFYMSDSGTTSLLVDQAQVTPAFLSAGTYTSCLLDAGAGSAWKTVTWTSALPASTSLNIQARTSADGSTWSAWSPISASGSGLAAQVRFAQFQAVLNTSNTQNSPALISLGASKASGPTPVTTAGPSATVAATATQTATATSTALPASTATAQPTNTATVTQLPTSTRTALPTTTSTPLPTNTATALPIPTQTASPLPTNTATALPIPTRTASPLPSATSTANPTATATTSPQPSPTATTIPAGGKVSSLQLVSVNPAVYERFEVQFKVQTSATTLDMPFDANPPAGVQAGSGVTVNGLFSSDNWQTTLTQPAFINQPYTHTVVNGKDHFTPAGAPVWDVRFAPQKAGAWQYRLSVQDSSGLSYYPDLAQNALTFSVGTTSSNPSISKGVIAVSPTDTRYFQFKDGTPFIGVGFNDGFNDSASVEQKMASYQQNKMNFMRVWQSGSGINGSQWTSWASSFLSQDGYLPGTNFDIANTYNGSPVSMRLDNASPCLYADFWQGGVPVEPGTTYQVSARVKVSGITGPASAGEYGFVIKQGGWLSTTCVNPGTGVNITTPITGSTDWTTVTGTYTTGSGDYWLGGLYLTRENASAGQVYIDEVHMYRANDPAKVDVLRQPYANTVEHFDSMNAAQWDLYIQSAEQHGVYLKLVIDEKNEWIRNHMGANGQMSATGNNDNFYAAPGTKVRWLEQAWWRYIIARWGYSTAVHSFEYINEGDPYNTNLYNASEAMAKYFHDNDPSRHMVTTSFWSSFPNKEFWSNPQYADIDYADIHAYISTGWGLNASFLPASMLETQPANIHSGNASAKVDGASSSSTSIVPRGVVIQGAGEWVIKYWMKTAGLTANCPYSGTGSMLRLHWLLDNGTYSGGKEGVVPANSAAKNYVCTSPAGTLGWTQFSSTADRDGVALPTSARIVLTDNNPHELNLIIENSYGTGGTAWIDDVQLINPAGKVQPVIGQFDTTPMDNDTAWYNQAYGELFGGGSLVGAHKPLVRGETGVDFVGNQTYNPDLLKDTSGIWLHNNVWGQINDSGMADLFWWATETIPSSIFSNFMTFQNFMAGIPLTNGKYTDSQAQTSNPQLRVIGQRDDVNGQMHLWIQNTQHNWKQVVNGPAPTPVSGTITLPNMPAGNYRVEWWNTYAKTNPIFLTQTVTANGTLTISLPAALADDEAVKISKIP